MWNPYESGTTINTEGSEGGIVVLDDEHSDGARVTLERDCPSGVPFAITCGVYGLMVHTRFLGNEVEARTQYDQMKTDLASFVEQLPDCQDGVPEGVSEVLSDFVEKYP